MAKVYDLTSKVQVPEDSQVLYLRSYLRNNIIELTKARAALVKVKDELARMKRAQLRVIPDATGNDNSQE